ncbi:hypothetical protein D3C73_938730 [compost metagenome]
MPHFVRRAGKAFQMSSLLPVIEFSKQTLAQLLHHLGQTVACRPTAPSVGKPRQICQNIQICFDKCGKLWPLNLDCHFLAISQNSTMNLPDRSRSQRQRLKGSKKL